MYKVIMAPTDGSGTEGPAVGLATHLAQSYEAELRLVRVDTPHMLIEPNTGTDGFSQTAKMLEEARMSRLRSLEALGTECRELGAVSVITALEEGPIAPTLRDYAERFDVDVIVMASHARGGIARIALGSVTDYLIRHTAVPVIVVKSPVALFSGGPGENVTRIVVPLDGSALAEQILPQVSSLASRLKATVSLLHVLTPSTYSQKQIAQPGLPWWDSDIAIANDYLDRAGSYLTESGIPVSKDVVIGDDVPSAIIDFSTRGKADMIAIATRGAGGLGRLVFGSVADEVTRRSVVSVLVFHPMSVVPDALRAPAMGAELIAGV